MRGRFAEIGRYLLVGSANTLSTLAVYQLLVTILSPAVAYGLAWLVVLSSSRSPIRKLFSAYRAAGREEERSQ